MLSIIKNFTDIKEYEKLLGGQNSAIKVGEIVLKPILDINKYIWIAEKFESINSEKILISKPIRSKNGNWIEDGYGATKFHYGEYYKGRIKEKMAATIIFHNLISNIEKPESYNDWRSPWDLANKVAWGELEIPNGLEKEVRLILIKLLEQLEKIEIENQLIHSDLAGNIMFDNMTPIIIDITPDFRPVEYALTLLITDSIAWHNEKVETMSKLSFGKSLRKQFILRAIIFRLCVPIFFNSKNSTEFLKELNNFKKILEYEDIKIE